MKVNLGESGQSEIECHRKEPNSPCYQVIMEKLSNNNHHRTRWTLQEVSELTGYIIATCRQVMLQAIKEGKVRRLDRIHYAFSDNESSKQPYTLKGHNCLGMTKEFFNEMLDQTKPLLAMNGGCSELQIKKQFRNLPASVVEFFIAEAIKKGIIREEPYGTFTLGMVNDLSALV